jgi:hypothetical protein
MYEAEAMVKLSGISSSPIRVSPPLEYSSATGGGGGAAAAGSRFVLVATLA